MGKKECKKKEGQKKISLEEKSEEGRKDGREGKKAGKQEEN